MENKCGPSIARGSRREFIWLFLFGEKAGDGFGGGGFGGGFYILGGLPHFTNLLICLNASKGCKREQVKLTWKPTKNTIKPRKTFPMCTKQNETFKILLSLSSAALL